MRRYYWKDWQFHNLLPWSGMIGSKRLTVHGGEVRLPSSLDGLSQRLNKKAPGQLVARLADSWQARFSGLTLLWQAPAADVRLAAWGIAGRGMYWRPVLHVYVAPEAEQRFAELSALLEGSGLTVERN